MFKSASNDSRSVHSPIHYSNLDEDSASDDDVYSIAKASHEDPDSDDEKDHQCHWRLQPTESVYDDGMMRILRWRTLYEKRGIIGGSCNLGALILLLACNCALQMTVVLRVITLVDLGKKRASEQIFRPTGACVKLDADVFGFLGKSFSQPQDRYWSCGPYLPLVLSNVDLLDVNKDGKWSKEDNLNASEKKWMNDLQALGGRVEHVFDRAMQDLKEGNFRYQKQNSIPNNEAKVLTNDFSSIPMSWMRAEQDVFTLCNIRNKNLCGNMELRGSLKGIFTNPQYDSADRVDECRGALDRCAAIFGEIYHTYTMRTHEGCGSGEGTWNDEHLVIVNRYKNAQAYDSHTDKNAITASKYEVFLILVLVIWWLSVIEELRNVLSWWAVLLTIPSEGGSVIDEKEDETTIQSVSWSHKITILLAINLPRTVIIVVLAWIGTDFLIVADNYTDLILNSVALAFLIEVDDMLFRALSSENTKASLAKLQDVKGRHRCCLFCIKVGNLPTSIPYMLLVGSLAFLQAYLSYVGATGKFELATAYRCLCHAEGSECITAQLVGGDLALDAKYF